MPYNIIQKNPALTCQSLSSLIRYSWKHHNPSPSPAIYTDMVTYINILVIFDKAKWQIGNNNILYINNIGVKSI